MCGRFASTQTDAELLEVFGALEVVDEPPPPSWNVAPTDAVRVVVQRTPKGHPDPETERQLRTARWGLVPSWAKDVKGGPRLINARAETITDKPSFTAAAARRRCVVPADGYYEWETRPDGKLPFFLHRGDDVLSMAGLYELWRDPHKAEEDPTRWLWTMTILTTRAQDAAGAIHDRSPLVLPASMVDDWLDPAVTDRDTVRDMLAAVPAPALQPYPVGRGVNNVRNNGPELLVPVDE